MAGGWEEVVVADGWIGTRARAGVGEADEATESKEREGETAESK
jgi:hypothetical protein